MQEGASQSPCSLQVSILLREKENRNYRKSSLQFCGMLLSILACYKGVYWGDLTSLGVPAGFSEEIKFQLVFE